MVTVTLLSLAGFVACVEEREAQLLDNQHVDTLQVNSTDFTIPVSACRTDCVSYCAGIVANNPSLQCTCITCGSTDTDILTLRSSRSLKQAPAAAQAFVTCLFLSLLTNPPLTQQSQIDASQSCCRAASCAGGQPYYCPNLFAPLFGLTAGVPVYQSVYCDRKHSKKGLLGLLGLLGLIPLLLCCLLFLLCCLRRKKQQPDVHFATFDAAGATPIGPPAVVPVPVTVPLPVPAYQPLPATTICEGPPLVHEVAHTHVHEHIHAGPDFGGYQPGPFPGPIM